MELSDKLVRENNSKYSRLEMVNSSSRINK